MGGLFRAFASGVDDDVAAFLAGEVGSLGGILQAVDGGSVGELDRFDGAVGGLHGNGFCSSIDLFDSAGDDVVTSCAHATVTAKQAARSTRTALRAD